MSICSCGHKTQRSDRYCSQCGQASGGQASSGQASSGQASSGQAVGSPASPDSGSGQGDLMLLNAESADRVETSSEVRTDFPLRWAVIGVLAVGALMWGLFAWPQTDSADALNADEMADDAESESDTADSDSSSDSESSNESESEKESPTTTERAEVAGAERDEFGLDSSLSEQAAIMSRDESEVGQIAPIPGELTGLGLAIGSFEGSRSVDVVMLDTGVEIELAEAKGRPVAMIGTHLVTADWEQIFVTDLSDEEPESDRIYNDANGWFERIYVEDDMIWTFANPFDGTPRLIGLSLDGQEQSSVDLPGPTSYFGTPGTVDITTSAGGGVYIRSGNDRRRLSTGALRAVGETLILVDECDVAMRCESVWYRREDWERLDFPQYPDFGLSLLSIEGGDRWLTAIDYQSNSYSLVEIATGEVVRTGNSSLQVPFPRVAISPDGRWLFEQPDFGDGVLVDLDRGVEWPVDRSFTFDEVAMLVDLSGMMVDEG